MVQTDLKNKYPFQIFSLNITIFTIFIISTGFFIYPSLVSFEEKKSELATLFQEKTQLEQKGIDYATFGALRNEKGSDNKYETNVLRAVSEEFYNEKMVNTSKDNFETFIKRLGEEVNKQKLEKVLETRQSAIDAVLPQYVDVNEPNTDGLTEFKFINYLETIIYSFSLSVEGNIGISEIVPLDGDKKKVTEGVDSSLFYIPLYIKISGRKSDIIDFLHFSENVGSVAVVDGVLEVYNDEILNSKAGGALGENIYKNQIFDYETLRMQEYMDSDSFSTEKDFVTYIKEEQGREKVSIELGLRFFVRGLADYKVRGFIKDLMKKQEEITKEINLKLKELKTINVRESSEMLITSTAIKNLNFEVSDLGKQIAKLNGSLGKDEAFSKSFKQALELSIKLEKMEKTLTLEGEKLEAYKSSKK